METKCIMGETKGLFGEVEDNTIALYLTASDIVNNNICWIIKELENSNFVIIGNTSVIEYYTVLFKWVGGLLQRKISWRSVNIDNVNFDLKNKELYEIVLESVLDRMTISHVYTANHKHQLIEYKVIHNVNEFLF
jgi:hypothetical protein